MFSSFGTKSSSISNITPAVQRALAQVLIEGANAQEEVERKVAEATCMIKEGTAILRALASK